MAWHGYMYVENVCGLVYGTGFVTRMKQLGNPNHPNPSHRPHWRNVLNGILLEGEYTDDEVSERNLKKLMAFALGLPAAQIETRTDTPDFNEKSDGTVAISLGYDGEDYARVTFFRGNSSEWLVSLEDAHDFLKAGELFSGIDPSTPASGEPTTPASLPNEVYVAPGGDEGGSGAIDDPVSLSYVAEVKHVADGGTIWLRAGTYAAVFDFQFSGGTDSYITIKNYNGERVIVDGGVILSGDWLRIEGVEITDTSFVDRAVQPGTGTTAVELSGDRLRVINCILKNGGQGVTASNVAIDHLIYGCLIYHNGWSQSGIGHGMYHQNANLPGKITDTCFIFDNFGHGYSPHASTSADVNYLTCARTTIFNNGSLNLRRLQQIYQQSNETIASPIIHNCSVYHGGPNPDDLDQKNLLGDPDNATNGVQIYDNYIAHPDGSAFQLFGSVIDITRMDGNTFIGKVVGWDTGTYSNNTYLDNVPDSGIVVSLLANTYDSDRAHLTMFNWDEANSVQVDVSSVFDAGDSITARNVQDYWTDIQPLTVAQDGTITVDVQAANRSVERPVGTVDYTPPTTFPQFGAFVLERTS